MSNKQIISFVIISLFPLFLFGQNRDSKSKGTVEQANDGKRQMELIQVIYNHNIDELKLSRNRIEMLKADSLLMHQLLNPASTPNQMNEKTPLPTPKVDSVQLLASKNIQLQDSLRYKYFEIIKLKDSTRQYRDYVAKLNTFYSEPFDIVLKNVTENVVIRDSMLLYKNNMSPKRISELRVYFDAFKLLAERYDQNQIELAKNKLRKIDDSKAIEVLISNLSYYLVINNSLKKTIDSISVIDFQKPTKGIEELQAKKQKDILAIITVFYRDNEHEPGVYIYLDKIIKELLKDKIANVDADVKKYLSRL
jgi:hypothetical protein